MIISSTGPKMLRRWMGAFAAHAGRRHIEKEACCEDVALASIEDDVAIVVVSDGAGSAPHSAEGAAVAAQTTIDVLRSTMPWIDADAVRESLATTCMAEMSKRAGEIGSDVHDLAATLAFVAVNQERYLAGNLGDGLVVATRSGSAGPGKPRVLIGQDRGEFVNETVFLTSSDAVGRISVVQGKADSYDGFAVMSDGAADRLFRRSDGTLAPLLDRLFSTFEEMTSSEVMQWLDESVMPIMMTQDDYSLGILRCVRMRTDSLSEREVHYQMEVLGCKNRIGLQNRINVLECCLGGKTKTQDICDSTGLGEVSARRHRRALNAILA